MKKQNTDFNTELYLSRLKEMGATLKEILDTPIVKATLRKKKELVFDISSSSTSFNSAWIACDKFYTKKVLEKHGVNVAAGKVFSKYDHESAIAYAQELEYPVVLKPLKDGHGNFVYSEISSEEELTQYMQVFANTYTASPHFLVEKHIPGEEFRIFISKNGVIAAVHRSPASITGDGEHSIHNLIQIENYRRMNPRTNSLCEIRFDEVLFAYLEKQHIEIDTVPKKGELIKLRPNSNVSTGGMCEDVTTKVHPSVKKLAHQIMKIVDGLSCVGIDLICQDISKPLSKQTWVVCELNPFPGLSLHTLPGKGKSRDVVTALVDSNFEL